MFGINSFYLIAGIMAFIPALIWLALIFRGNRSKTVQILIFLSGIASVIPIFALQILFQKYPELNFVTMLQGNVENPHYQFLILFIWVGITEELIKQWLLRAFDSKYLVVQTINDSINYSLIAALGFAFAENIFYFYQIGTKLGIQTLFVAYLFRSIFTTCAHLVFSGYFGYYYGIAKFSISIVEESANRGNKFILYKILGKFLNISKIQAFKEATILKGLFIAIIIHALYDYILQFNLILPAAILIIVSYGILLKLLKNRSGQLILVQDSSENRSSMAKTDEDVVIELLGMWFNQNKLVDVIHICERLLKRDPNNKVVALFKARALDKLDSKSPYQSILQKMFPDKNTSYSIEEMKAKAETVQNPETTQK